MNAVTLVGKGYFSEELISWADAEKTNFCVKTNVRTDELPDNAGAPFYISLGGVADKEKYADFVQTRGWIPCDYLTVGDQLLARDVDIGRGSLLMNNVSLATRAVVGEHCDIHGGSILGHGVRTGNFVSIGANCFLGGEVTIGSRVQIFPGVNIAPRVSICSGATIGIGSSVIRDVTEPGTYFGNPAKKIL